MILLFGYAVTLFTLFICNVGFNYYKINLLDRSNRDLYAYVGVFQHII